MLYTSDPDAFTGMAQKRGSSELFIRISNPEVLMMRLSIRDKKAAETRLEFGEPCVTREDLLTCDN